MTLKAVALKKFQGTITFPVVVFIDQYTDKGDLALAAALRDQQRATIIGEQRATITGTAISIFNTGEEWFAVPSGDLRHIGGQRLATTGVRVVCISRGVMCGGL